MNLPLTAHQLEQFQTYYEQMVEWNRRVNLTAITSYEDAQVKHFLDSLTITLALDSTRLADDGIAMIDIGTGAGLPGIPWKILRPETRLILLDSVAKKTAFLRHIVEKLGLNGVEVITGRAEDVAQQPQYREKFDLVVCRAVSQLATVAELALPFSKFGGLAIAFKSGSIDDEVARASRAMDILGGRMKGLEQVTIEGLEQHVLVVMEKVSATPHIYPRRPGMPAKHPIRG